jgi:hypothetical protein
LKLRTCNIGWYHSHPVFQPDPSIRDIENQTNYQNLLKDANANVEPFVGIIFGPYDIRMPTEETTISISFFMIVTHKFPNHLLFYVIIIESV